MSDLLLGYTIIKNIYIFLLINVDTNRVGLKQLK